MSDQRIPMTAGCSTCHGERYVGIGLGDSFVDGSDAMPCPACDGINDDKDAVSAADRGVWHKDGALAQVRWMAEWAARGSTGDGISRETAGKIAENLRAAADAIEGGGDVSEKEAA